MLLVASRSRKVNKIAPLTIIGPVHDRRPINRKPKHNKKPSPDKIGVNKSSKTPSPGLHGPLGQK
jgi:hypothetical protein